MPRLKAKLTLLQGIGLLVTTLLGTGVFVVPSITADAIGSQSLFAWALLLLVTIPITLTFAALGKRYPHAGGVPHMVGKAFGTIWEKYAAFLFITMLPVAVPAALVIGAGFIRAIIPISTTGALLIELAMLAGMFITGYFGSQASAKLQMPIALFILALVALLWWSTPLTVQDYQFDWQFNASLLPALGIMFWCIIGLEAFVHMGEEFKNPQRDFPLALVLGTLITLALYWGTNVIVLKYAGALDGPHSGSLPTITAALFGPKAGFFVSALGFCSCFASTNTYIQGSARLFWSMADEGKLPARLARLNRHQAPLLALALVTGVCALVAVAIWLLNLNLSDLLLYSNGNFVAIYLLAMLAGAILLTGINRLLAIVSAVICGIFLYSVGIAASYLFVLSALFALWHWSHRSRFWQKTSRRKTV